VKSVKRITLLLGAGFSFDLGMPLADELTELLVDPFDWRSTRALGATLAAQDPYGEGRPINAKAIHEALDLVRAARRRNQANYEETLAQIQQLGDRPGKNQSDRDSYHYVFGFLYELVHAILYEYQLDAHATLYKLNRAHFSPITNILSNEAPTWVFSLNHDIFLESLAIDHKIPLSDGANGSIAFPVSNQAPTDTINFMTSKREDLSVQAPGWLTNGLGINLVRLHGGLAELEYKDGSLICNPSLHVTSSDELIQLVRRIESMSYFHMGNRVTSGKHRVVTGPDGTLDIMARAMRTGGKKYSKTSKPKVGEERIKMFADMLDDTSELLIIGYGFGDVHVNNRISNALARNPQLTVRSIRPKGERCPQFLEQFDYDQRVGAAYCRAAEWMHYVPTQTWNDDLSIQLRENERIRNEIKSRVREKWLKSRTRR
jgi:hypothetical protein